MALTFAKFLRTMVRRCRLKSAVRRSGLPLMDAEAGPGGAVHLRMHAELPLYYSNTMPAYPQTSMFSDLGPRTSDQRQ